MAHDRSHNADSHGDDSPPIERYEDHLLDPAATAEEREQQAALAASNPKAADRLLDRLFVHGLLVSEADSKSSRRVRRLRSAIDSLPAQPLGSTIRVVPRSRWGVWVAAAALVIAVGVTAWGVFGRDQSADQNGREAGGGSEAPSKLDYRLLDGTVKATANAGGTWTLASDAKSGATLRFGDNFAVLAPGSNILVDATGGTFELLSGTAALEGEGIRAKVAGRVAQLWGGPALIARNGAESIDLFAGRMNDESGLEILTGGQTYDSATGRTLSLSLTELPDWVASGRAEDVFTELNRLSGGKLTDQKAAWLESLRPMLAEPVTRSSIQSACRELLGGGLSSDEVQGILEILGAGLTAFKRMTEEKGRDYEEEVTMLARRIAANQSRLSEEVRDLHRKQRDALLGEWRKLSAEERERFKVWILRALDGMGRAPAPRPDPAPEADENE